MTSLALRIVCGISALALVVATGCSGGTGDDTNSEFDIQFRGGDVADPDDQNGAGNDSADPPDCKRDSDCPTGRPYCDPNLRICVACRNNEHCTAGLPYCHPATHVCVECIMDHQCGTGRFCLEGSCSDSVCFPGKATCVGNAVHICSPDGMNPSATVVPCGEQKCHQGTCLECTPSARECKGNLVIQCDSQGSGFAILDTCGDGKDCIGGQCLTCYPGGKKCEGQVAYQCRTDGSVFDFLEDCSQQGKNCVMGTCISPCASDLKENTNAGCEFYAVDLRNAVDGEYDAQDAQFAIIVSNTSAVHAAEVTLTLPDGTAEVRSVAASSIHKFKPKPTWGITGTEKSKKAFKITANRPITVYQFNPLDNEQVFSNDASLLLPAPNLGNEYRVMSYQQMGTTFRPFFAVVGISPGTTKVDIRPKSRTLSGTGVPAMEKDALGTHHIEYGQVLNIEGDQAGGDLTGTHILSDKPVAVFGGHEATNMAAVCCADHLEQQLVPVAAWGKKYVISKAFERWMERDYVRIVASQDFTTVSLNPAVATVPELRAGEHYTFTTNANVLIAASKPVMVAQFLAASHEILGSYTDATCSSNGDCAPGYKCDTWFYECEPPSCTTGAGCPSGHTCESYGISGGYCEPIGDPSMMLAVPEEQFLDSYVFLAPDAYLRDYVNIIAPMDANTVMLDGKQIPMSQFVPVSSSGFGVYRTEISDGIHTLTSDKKVGVMVYGYDNDVSYGYPGGMGLGQQ